MRKNIVAVLLLLVISFMAFGQQTTISLPLQNKELLETSKSQKLIGHIFLIGGIASIVTAFVYPQGKEIITSGNSGIFGGGPPIVNSHHENDGTKATFGLVGVLASSISIPFYLGAERNKKKGMSLSLKNEMAPQLQKNSFVNRSVPSLTLKISLINRHNSNYKWDF